MNACSARRSLLLALSVALAARCGLSRPHDDDDHTRRARDALPRVACFARKVRAVFGPRAQGNLHVQDSSGAKIPVPRHEGPCGVRKGRERKSGALSFYSRYDSCYGRVEGSSLVLPLLVQVAGGEEWFKVNISCPLIKTRPLDKGPRPAPTILSEECNVESALRVHCGPQSVSSDACQRLGCCYDPHDSICFYRLNACSLDGHFVFSVKTTDMDPPLDPWRLVVKDQPHCDPVITTADAAVFKIGVTDCGATMKIDGDVMTYEVEVETLQAKTVTEHSPFSLQVQCDYKTSEIQRAKDMRSLHVVTTPPAVIALGTIRVQMRIATDASFTSFIPEEQLPMTFPLREAVYVEVSIAQPSLDSTLSLHVRDCFAYPASRNSVWTLLYDGCPNPLDNMRSSVPVDNYGQTNSHSQVRRFDVKTFAFLDPHTSQPSAEAMYFYCWVEICTEDIECSQPCALISSDGKRPKREALSGAREVQQASLGPLLLNQNITEQELTPCAKQKTMLQVMFYALGAVCTALLLLCLISVRSCMKMRHLKEEQDCDTPETEPEEAKSA